MTADVLDAGKALIAVSSSAFGTDNSIRIPAATAHGIVAFNHRGFGRVPVSEHAVMLVLAAMKQLLWGDRPVRDGSAWGRAPTCRSANLTAALSASSVRASSAPRQPAGSSMAFDAACSVTTYADLRLTALADVELVPDLYDLLRRSQVLILAPAFTDETRNMIGATELATLPKGAIVINVGRVSARPGRAGRFSGKRARGVSRWPRCLLSRAPSDPYPLLSDPTVTFTPHIGGITTEATFQLARSAAEQIGACLKGHTPRFAVNPEAWSGPN